MEVLAQTTKLPVEELGVWGVLVFLVVREGYTQISKRRNGGNAANAAPERSVVYRDHQAQAETLQRVSETLVEATSVLKTIKSEMCDTHRQMVQSMARIETKLGARAGD